MKQIIIFLTGSKGSGKTTTFNILKELCPDIIEIQLAKKLKDTCAEVFKINRNLFDDPVLKEVTFVTPIDLDLFSLDRIANIYNLKVPLKNILKHEGKKLYTPRHLLQYIGTEVLREQDNAIHCEWATRDLPEEGIFVVTDGRFVDEFHYFKNKFKFTFFPYYINRECAEKKAATDMHASEQNIKYLKEKCKLIDNNGTLSLLFNNVLIAFEDVLMDTSFTDKMVYSNFPFDGKD